MIKEIEFIDTAGSCLIDESNVFNDEYQSIFQIQCTKLSVGWAVLWKYLLLQNNFSLRLVCFPLCLIDTLVIPLPSLLLQVMWEMERMTMGVGSQENAESWGSGITFAFCVVFGMTLAAGGWGYLFLIRGHSPSLQSWSKIDRSRIVLYHIFSLPYFVSWCKKKKKCPVKTIWVNPTILATNPIQWIYKLLAFRCLSW